MDVTKLEGGHNKERCTLRRPWSLHVNKLLGTGSSGNILVALFHWCRALLYMC